MSSAHSSFSPTTADRWETLPTGSVATANFPVSKSYSRAALDEAVG